MHYLCMLVLTSVALTVGLPGGLPGGTVKSGKRGHLLQEEKGGCEWWCSIRTCSETGCQAEGCGEKSGCPQEYYEEEGESYEEFFEEEEEGDADDEAESKADTENTLDEERPKETLQSWLTEGVPEETPEPAHDMELAVDVTPGIRRFEEPKNDVVVVAFPELTEALTSPQQPAESAKVYIVDRVIDALRAVPQATDCPDDGQSCLLQRCCYNPHAKCVRIGGKKPTCTRVPDILQQCEQTGVPCKELEECGGSNEECTFIGECTVVRHCPGL